VTPVWASDWMDPWLDGSTGLGGQTTSYGQALVPRASSLITVEITPQRLEPFAVPGLTQDDCLTSSDRA